ncbi:sulfatase family protein [Persicirhabdus sediminis]|uniref:Sulfatase-like hydrolase/transferase n=1 Tax=Persicirhabdus sediminis TaxID=454144 RepID=A0A8J7MFT2_9BACT|nr:sulfatase-like hydrolase/transferase [Persicirhabdus sediminis]MBK1791398.1 sulfatase-like hydrolase/transferase [Persicirhabdus sediminis]
MMKKSYLAALTLPFIAAGSLHAEDTSRPNIILMMADDLGWGDVGYNGNTVIKTPSIDQMAEQGARLDRFYAAAPVCSPTRASALTGRHPYRTGIFSANLGILRPEEVTIAKVLKPLGYATGHFGKWHLGTLTATEKDANRGGPKSAHLLNPPTDHGFDTYFATESKVPTWDPMKLPEKIEKPGSKGFGWSYIKEGEAYKDYGTAYWTPEGKATENLDGDDSRVIMDRAIPFIEEAVKNDKPFFTVIWFHTPHLPCVAGPEYAEMYKDLDFKMQQYAGCITAMDDQIGRLRTKLDELGVANNTMVWFCSDNGPESSGKSPGSSGEYSGRKRSLHDGGVRVPGVMVWPNVVSSPMTISAPIVTSDYLPTIVEAVGAKKPPYELDGVSVLPLLKGESIKRDPIGFIFKGVEAFNGEKYKYYRSSKSIELYDMENDPYEKNNIADQHPEIVEQFKKQIKAWHASCRSSFEGAEYGTDSLERVEQDYPEVLGAN